MSTGAACPIAGCNYPEGECAGECLPPLNPQVPGSDTFLREDKRAKTLQTQEGGSHYRDMAIQPIEYIHANGIGFVEGAVIKYVSRWKAKDGLRDLRKAIHLLQILVELEEINRGSV